MNIKTDREAAITFFNNELKAEELPLVELTGKSFISPAGYVWHEVKDDHNYLSYITTSTLPELARLGSKVHGAIDLEEAFLFDSDF